jgi:hypothetical protein
MMLLGGPGSVIRDLTIRLPEDVSANAFALETRNLARRVKVVAAYQQHYEHIGVYLTFGGTLEDSSVDLNRPPETTALVSTTGWDRARFDAEGNTRCKQPLRRRDNRALACDRLRLRHPSRHEHHHPQETA